MRPSRPHFLPVTPLMFGLLFFLLGFLLVLIEIDILRYAYAKIGMAPHYVFALLLLSLLGSFVNIPVATLATEEVLSGQEVRHFGRRYVIPVVREWPRTVIAVNVGGAVIPTLLSGYLLVTQAIYGVGFLGIAIVAAVVYWRARPMPGVGIVVPMFLPPLTAAIVALLLAPSQAPPLAYVCGSLGTLIGGDLLNLGSIRGLRTPIASIGGSGTFDGIFLAGILAVLLTS